MTDANFSLVSAVKAHGPMRLADRNRDGLYHGGGVYDRGFPQRTVEVDPWNVYRSAGIRGEQRS